MERIHNLLRKIQDVYYSKEEKQTIDIDLMLDYTRVLYADLLEWKSTIKEPKTIEPEPAASKIEATAVVEPEQKADVVPVTPEEEMLDRAEEDAKDNIVPEVPASEQPEVNAAAVAADEASALELAVTEENNPVVKKAPEVPVSEQPEVNAAAVAEEEAPANPVEGAIETPAAADKTEEEETVPEAIEADEMPAEEAPADSVEEAKAQVVINDEDYPKLSSEPEKVTVAKAEDPVHSEIHFELPVVNDEAVKSSGTDYVFERPRKDVRSFIGINDKYQFMNELFGNNKTAYEETLDKINFCNNLKEAEQWISKEATRRYNWSEEDVTYQSLLATVKKFYA